MGRPCHLLTSSLVDVWWCLSMRVQRQPKWLNKAKLQSAKQRCAEIENGNGEAKGLGVKLGCSKDWGKGLILEDVAAFFHFKDPIKMVVSHGSERHAVAMQDHTVRCTIVVSWSDLRSRMTTMIRRKTRTRTRPQCVGLEIGMVWPSYFSHKMVTLR